MTKDYAAWAQEVREAQRKLKERADRAQRKLKERAEKERK